MLNGTEIGLFTSYFRMYSSGGVEAALKLKNHLQSMDSFNVLLY